MAISKLTDGKYEVQWPIATVTVGGHTVTGRPETIAALNWRSPEGHDDRPQGRNARGM